MEQIEPCPDLRTAMVAVELRGRTGPVACPLWLAQEHDLCDGDEIPGAFVAAEILLATATQTLLETVIAKGPRP